ncbi:MAG TPA: FHA domain-containing protein [Syntrophomonadaceae bacterium]|nr:FHA domain-containing protein [Syntrophomonadaceae bacterium]
MTRNKSCIIIEKGEPYENGTEIILAPGSVVLGRPWKEHQPDLHFLSPHISKQHAKLIIKDELVTLIDLDSKHGTQVNGTDIVPRKRYALKNNDQITLAKGVVSFRLNVHFESEAEQTTDLQFDIDNEEPPAQFWVNSIVIDPKKREVYIKGQKTDFIGKEIELLLVLYEKANQATSIEDIKQRVWPERSIDPITSIPDVGADEINSLIYRLRKRMKEQGDCIVTIPRFGYRLDIEL